MAMNLTLSNKNPFSTFDFLGYLFPGAFMLILAYALSDGFKHPDITSVGAYTILHEFATKSTIVSVILFIVFSYMIGHLTSYLSSVTVELFYTWCYGYPTDYLFASGKGAKSKAIVPPTIGKRHMLWRVLICIPILPVVIAHSVFEKLLGIERFIAKALPKEAQKVIIQKSNEYFKAMGFNESIFTDSDKQPKEDIDAHRFVMHYVYEHCKEHIVKFDNYVALYGFVRSLTFILSACFLYSEYRFINNEHIIIFDSAAWYNSNCVRWGIYFLIALIIASRIGIKKHKTYFNSDTENTPTRRMFQLVINSVILGMSYSSAIMLTLGLIFAYLQGGEVFAKAFILFSLFTSAYLSYLAFAKFYRRFSLENFMALVICREIKEKEEKQQTPLVQELKLSDHIIHLYIDKQSSWITDLRDIMSKK